MFRRKDEKIMGNVRVFVDDVGFGVMESMRICPPTGCGAFKNAHLYQMKETIKLDSGHGRMAKVVHIPS
jgi:hypothetical protein